MDKYQETFQTWNKIAKLYEEKFMDLELYNESYNYLVDQIKLREAKILEVGCGPGNISKYLLEKDSSFKIKGIDIAPNMIELAKKNNPSAEFQIMDVRELDKLNDSFDAIVCGFCLPYLSKKDSIKLIRDANNLLNEKGVLYISFVEGNYNNSSFISGSNGDRTYFYFYNMDFIYNQFKINSFIETKVFRVKYHKNYKMKETHTILIGKKTNTQQ